MEEYITQGTGKIRLLNQKIAQIITHIIFFFYPPFKRIIPEQVFRYGAAGAANTLLDWFLYFVFYNFVFRKELFNLNCVTITPHIAAMITVFPITILTGFWLSRYVSFPGAPNKKGKQLTLYIVQVLLCLAINYFGLKLFVERLNFYPTPSKMIITVITVILSFFMQKYITFKQKTS